MKFRYLYFRLPYLETSAATGQNINRAIDTLLELVMTRIETDTDRTLSLGNRKEIHHLPDDRNDIFSRCQC